MPEQRPQIPPLSGRGTPGWDVAVEDKVNGLLNGKANVSDVLTVTLQANDVTTTLVDSRIGYFSHISFTAKSATAAAALAGLWYEAAAGSATLHHTNTADADKTLSYAVFG